jgi:hypothetical protein
MGVAGGEKKEPKAAEEGEGHHRQGPVDGGGQNVNAHPAVHLCQAPMGQLGQEVGSGKQERGCHLSRRYRGADDNAKVDTNVNAKRKVEQEQQRKRQHVNMSTCQHGNTSTREMQCWWGRGPKVIVGGLGARRRHVRRTCVSRCQAQRSSRTTPAMFELVFSLLLGVLGTDYLST